MRALNEKYDIYIVSAAVEFPNSLSEKYYWLQEHFSFLDWRKIVFCGNKGVINGDIMIDDTIHNLDSFGWITFLYTQPHNLIPEIGRHRRINNWNEIAVILLS